MKTSLPCARLVALCFKTVLFLVGALSFVSAVHAQAPALLWTTNIGATLFAVDANTNVYASRTGLVIRLNADGVPLATNVICPLNGFAQRDALGNFYFAGNTTSSIQDFGGGWILTNKAVYVAKYSSAGTLIWVGGFGPGYVVEDFVMDSDGNLLVAGMTGTVNREHVVIKFDPTGTYQWHASVIYFAGVKKFRITSESPNILYAVSHGEGPFVSSFYRIDANGNVTYLTGWGSRHVESPTPPGVVLNSFGQLYNVENDPSSGNSGPTKRSPLMTSIWHVVASPYQRGVGRDQYDGVHTASDSATLSRYDFDGNLVWTRSLPSNCAQLLLDANGNRFLGLSGGAVARLGAETVSAPTITNELTGATLFAGSNYTFSVGATGSGPLRYYWLFNNAPIPGNTNFGSTLSLTNLTAAQGGNYSVIVSNFLGSVTSAPALLRVKMVQFFLGNQMLTNGTYTFTSPPTLSILSAFTNGSSFYTTNGSTPSFSSTPYLAPFLVSTSAMLRAIGYSADFLQSEEADPVNFILPPTFSLSITSTPGGTVTPNPAGGIYVSNTVVTITAAATNGWSFLYWLGDASGANPSVNVTINANKTVQAVFGTTLGTTVAGNGQVLLSPPSGPYPYGAIVRLTGVPQPGNYFGVWGNAASGNTNPLYFTISSPTPTVSSLFAATPEGQAALTVAITGRGKVDVSPRANVYATNASVTLTATPDASETFLGWSGDAAGALNPLTLNMAQSRLVIASFSGGPLELHAVGLLPEGFRLTVGEPFRTYQIYGSTNLTNWSGLGSVSNSALATPFTDATATNWPAKFYRASQ